VSMHSIRYFFSLPSSNGSLTGIKSIELRYGANAHDFELNWLRFINHVRLTQEKYQAIAFFALIHTIPC
jgi:hypothetical protein